MPRYTHIFFDLDGTLTDSAPGILNSVRYALERLGAPVPEREALFAFIGPPLPDSFRDRCGFGPEQAREATRLYREYFEPRGLYENSVYPGIPALLERLRASGLWLGVATSKPERFARRILDHFGLTAAFDCIAGADLDGQRSRKADVLRYAMAQSGVGDPEKALMVGDREHDALGAREAGLDCLGVLYGYGSREELLEAGVRYLAETVPQVGELILGLI
ncbi:MAG: HAD family hydrolase [Oscillospiraceae bacterium]|nr:HAD family hydrolase [Oscillospiraceae bacterium]